MSEGGAGNNFIVGWREWAALPGIEVPLIKVKIDTGAKISAIHAQNLEIVTVDGERVITFVVHPIQGNDTVTSYCQAKLLGTKRIKSSNGMSEDRPLVRTSIQIGGRTWEIDMTLTNRDIMKHRMLLGREAMQHILVDPTKSYCQGEVSDKQAMAVYDPLAGQDEMV